MINQQETRDKQLLAWEREREVLWRRLSNPPVHLLPEPIQRGWKRHYVLTAEAAHRPDAPTLAAILAEINSAAYFWRRDFQPSRRALRLRRRQTYSHEQPLRALNPEAWNRQDYPAAWRGYFQLELVPGGLVNPAPEKNPSRRAQGINARQVWASPHDWRCETVHMFAFVFRFPRLFALRVERNWLTHVSEIEPDVVERVAELHASIDRRGGRHRLDWLRNRSRHHWRCPDDRERMLRKLAIREMRVHLGVPVSRHSSPGVADAMPSPCSLGWRHGVGGVWQAPAFAAVKHRAATTIARGTAKPRRGRSFVSAEVMRSFYPTIFSFINHCQPWKGETHDRTPCFFARPGCARPS